MNIHVRLVLSLALILGCAINAQAEELSWAQKMFEKQKHDFGVVARGADARYRLKVTNLYKKTVHISNVRTTCGCSAAIPSKTTLASLDSAYIEISMNTVRFTRRKDSNVIVTFDQPQYREVRIPVTAYIRTDVVLSPGSAKFGPTDRGKDAKCKIEIAYAGRDDWKILEVKTDSRHIDAKVMEKSRGGGRVYYELNVTLKGTASVGPLREQIFLITNDVIRRGRQVPVLVEARVESDVTVTPDVISLGTLFPKVDKKFNVVIRGKGPIAIVKIECDSDREAFKVRLPKSARSVHVIPMTFTSPNEPGDFSEEFSVTIAGRPEPVTFKAYGKIVP